METSTDPTAALHEALDGLGALDVSSLADDELGEAVVALSGAASRLAAQRARVLAAFDARRDWAGDGSRSAAAWLSHHCGLPGGEARADIRFARALRALPALAVALGRGELRAAVATLFARRHASALGPLLERDEATLVEQVAGLSYRGAARVLAYWAQLVGPEAAEKEGEALRAGRRLHLSRTLGGEFVLDGLLDPIGGSVVSRALETIDDELFAEDWRDARLALGRDPAITELARTPAQRRADALVELARRAMAMPPGARRPAPLVTVLVGYETFAGRVCELADGTVLAPGQVARLLDEALVERIVFDGPSRVIDVGSPRLFTDAQRRAIEVRDRHCTHPGCEVPAHRCQADHVVGWTRGGPTTLANGQLRCGPHNRWKERRGPPRRGPGRARPPPPATP